MYISAAKLWSYVWLQSCGSDKQTGYFGSIFVPLPYGGFTQCNLSKPTYLQKNIFLRYGGIDWYLESKMTSCLYIFWLVDSFLSPSNKSNHLCIDKTCHKHSTFIFSMHHLLFLPYICWALQKHSFR